MKYKKAIKKLDILHFGKKIISMASCRKIFVRLIIYVMLMITAMAICAITNNLTANKSHEHQRYRTDFKYILLWKPQMNSKIFGNARKIPKLPEGQNIFIKQKCKNLNCYITYDKNLLENDHRNLDAIIFNVRDIVQLKSGEFNLTRSPNQVYIFRSLDSSALYPVCDRIFENFFNWTWTYKLNSDIPHPFYNIYDINNQLIGPKLHIKWTTTMESTDRFQSKIQNKSKAVAWLVQNCKLKEKYQEFISELTGELKAYNYTLDTFGSCGHIKCPRVTECYRMIEEKYYFQLVLEDTLAIDYVTERMGTAMTYLAIPIVLGVSQYNSFLPPGSYINAQAFEMKRLGAIIDYLIRYRSSYMAFFDWKNHYYYTIRSKRNVCDLCDKLNGDTSATRTYTNFRTWWNINYKDTCRNLQSQNMLTST